MLPRDKVLEEAAERKGDTFQTEECLVLRALGLEKRAHLAGPLWGQGSPWWEQVEEVNSRWW